MRFSKSLILAGAIALASLVTPASAADQPVYKQSPAPVFNWTGFYGGVHVGYGFGETKDTVLNTLAIDTNGVIGGFQVGYLSDMGIWAVGLEADMSFGNLGGDASIFGINVEQKYRYESTVRGIVGIPMNNGRWLPYVTAGVSFADVKLSAPALGLTSKDTYTGFIAGAGLRWASSNTSSWDLSYLYTNYGSVEAFGTPNAIDMDNHKLKLAYNYRFSW